MKNKVMGKALSWVLSAAMALTMSGAIPAMTTNVYASTAEAGLHFANESSLYTINDTLTLGTNKSGDQDAALVWKFTGGTIENNDTTLTNAYAMQIGTAFTGKYDSSWASNLSYTAEEGNALLSSTISGGTYKVVTKVASTNGTELASTEVTSAKVMKEAVSGKVWLPSISDETLPSSSGTYWMRDTVDSINQPSTATSTLTASNYQAAYVSGTTTQEALAKDYETGSYLPHATLDVSNRANVLFATLTGTSWVLTLPGTSTAPVASSVVYSNSAATYTNDKVTITLGSDTPSGSKLGYFITDAAYSTAISVAQSGNLTVSTDKTTGAKTASITSKTNDNLTGKYVYIYYYAPVSSVDPTMIASKITQVTTKTVKDPTASDIKWTAAATSAMYGTAVKATDFSQKTTAASGEDTTIDKGTATVKYVVKSGTTTQIKLPSNLDAGTYTYYGDVAQGESVDGNTIYNAAKDLAFGTFTVKQKELATTNISKITLADITQFSDKSYTVASAALTLTGSGIVTTDKVNALNAKVTLTSTSVPGPVNAHTVVISSIDNANYSLPTKGLTLTDSTAAPVKIVADTISSVDVYQQPFNTYVAKDAASVDWSGLELVVSYKGGGKQYIDYLSGTNDGYFTFNPTAANFVKTTGTKSITVTYKDKASGSTFECATKVPMQVVTTASDVTAISLPKSASVNVGADIDMPTVTYTPSNATSDRTVTWTYAKAASATTGAIKLVDPDGQTVSSGIASDKKLSIEGVTAGKVTLTATVATNIVATMTITVNDAVSDVSYERVYGDDRYATAAAIATAYVKVKGTPSRAILVSGENFPDALAANGLAGKLDCPILLTAKDKLPESTAALITKWNLSSIIIIGGTSVISQAVEDGIKSSYGITPSRIYGDDRYATARDVYTEGGFTATNDLVITTGIKAADALSISPWAYSQKMGLLLADAKGNLDSESLKIAMKTTGTIYILGGDKAVSTTVESQLKSNNKATDVIRLKGDDRYETSVSIAEQFAGQTGSIYYNNTCFASGDDKHYVDALVSGMFAGVQNSVVSGATTTYNAAPVVLVDGTSGAGFTLVSNEYVKQSNNVSMLYFIGGTSAVTTSTANKVLSNWTKATEIKQ